MQAARLLFMCITENEQLDTNSSQQATIQEMNFRGTFLLERLRGCLLLRVEIRQLYERGKLKALPSRGFSIAFALLLINHFSCFLAGSVIDRDLVLG